MRRDVERLQALGHAAAAEHVLDRSRVDVGVALEQLVDDVGGGLVGAQLGERALEGAPDRAADGVDDHGFGHLRGSPCGRVEAGARTVAEGRAADGDEAHPARAGEPTTGRTPRGLAPERVAESCDRGGRELIDVRRTTSGRRAASPAPATSR